MNLPLEITFRHMDTSATVEARISSLAARLDRFSSHIMRCHAIVEGAASAPSSGQPVRCEDRYHNARCAVVDPTCEPSHPRARGPFVALRDAFRAARRKLQDYEREPRGAVKHHVGLPHGRISELATAQGFGGIETDDRRLIYFHHNSMLGKPFQGLTTGTEVSFAEEVGARGPQASTVHVL